ncbi:hypothetical protein QTJ16_002078 [Diplocarpon rosae]|uniref:Regulatory factor Sgt1 n=1 Tax=Diplocarpon rosae TaxID=946125 RepID=A0AAD9T423_9HELO|nr:hypothetical protein QTJ16_002078 [Diplocarpon rosae]PBP23102.1 ecdysoneless [Diplocarpon rosae]
MNVPDDGFKGFGEGFDAFPRRLPEDCVEYLLFIVDLKIKSQRELLGRLEDVRKETLKITGDLLKDYIWQREAFNLELESGKGLMYLHGLTNYGDSVEDEWLIVYILKELSKRFANLWIKVVDTDGEFLLIEAANALPRWLNPEIADNRVWINNNKLRIIPLRVDPASPSTKKPTAPISRSLSLDEAQMTIRSIPESLIHSPLVEEEAFYRLRSYPSQITASLHHTPITVPRKLAYLMHGRPTSIAPAVEAFYLRDPVALKPLQSASSELTFPPTDLVTISTRFTKVLYAQLKSQQFSPPFSWKEILAGAAKHVPSDHIGGKKYTQLEAGMKVTSGFEMLLTDPKNKDNRTVRELRILLDDLEAGDEPALPTDQEIETWKEIHREDPETWLDINFQDFERELDGETREEKKPPVAGVFGPELPSGFGDARTQADLKKMVERFEAFLNDDEAGISGAEVDDMDIDDDDDEDDEIEGVSEDEDKDVSFDENEFTKMMREMMGMPSEEDDGAANASLSKHASAQVGDNRIEELDSSGEGEGDDEASEIRKLMEQMGAELNETGALNLDPTSSKLGAIKNKWRAGKERTHIAGEVSDDDSESDDETNIDFNLAKNLLESFKAQAGMSGPGGNIMGMMGFQLPRDEGDSALPSTKN